MFFLPFCNSSTKVILGYLVLQATVQNLQVFDVFFQLIVSHAEVGDRISEVPYLGKRSDPEMTFAGENFGHFNYSESNVWCYWI